MVSPIAAVKVDGEKEKPDAVTLICLAATVKPKSNDKAKKLAYFFIQTILVNEHSFEETGESRL